MFVLEVADLNSQAIEATLDDDVYYIVLNWNESSQHWTMNLRNSGYRTLVNGIALVPEYFLLKQFRYPDMPPGELIVFDYTISKTQAISRDGFLLGRYELVYVSRDEILTLEAAGAI